jgi:hypothetical protein
MHIPSTVWAEPPWPFAAELPRPLAPESGCVAEEGAREPVSRRLPAPPKPSPAPAASGEQPDVSKRAAPAKPTAGLQAAMKPLEPLPPLLPVLPDPDARPWPTLVAGAPAVDPPSPMVGQVGIPRPDGDKLALAPHAVTWALVDVVRPLT